MRRWHFTHTHAHPNPNQSSVRWILWSLPFVLFGISVPVHSLRWPFLSSNPDDIKFYIYTNKSNTDQYNEIIYGRDDSIIACGYDPTKPLVLLVHGVLSSPKTITDVQAIKNVYLETEFSANIIMVDYSKLTVSKIPPYLSTLSILLTIGLSFSTNLIGARLAKFIEFLINARALEGPQNVHMIGFSIGAHMAGLAGRHVKANLGTPVARITGLDPSIQWPLRYVKLVQSDASFVDCTYVTFAKLGNLATRIGLRPGHVHFYLNGGDRQPHCPNLAPFVNPFCSHASATYYFAKSVKFKDIVACKCKGNCRGNFLQTVLGSRIRENQLNCEDQTIYGQYTPTSARGNYYVSLT